MSVASTNSLMCASISSRLTAPSDNPRENAKPADVVAIAVNPRCCKYFAVPMSHGFGIAKHPLSCSRRNSFRFCSLVGIAQCRERSLDDNLESGLDGGMKTKQFISTICLALLPLSCALSAGADEKAVRDADEAWSNAAAAKDVDKTVAFYSNDAVVMPPNAERATTKEAVRKIWKDLLTDAKVSWRATKVEVAKSGEIGFVIGTYEVTMNDVVTGKPVNDRGKYLEVWEKQTDG